MTASGVDMKPRKAMNPDRLRKLIDSPSIVNATRDTPMAIIKRQTQATSWNGEQCDVRPYGKLAPAANVILAKNLRECTIGGEYGVALVPSGLQILDAIFHPRDDQLQDRLTAPVQTIKESFGRGCEVEHRVVPNSVMLSEGIMTPQERRERQRFETDHYAAKRAIHQAEMSDRRLHQIIKERHTTCDVTGTLHHPSPTPRIRGEPFKADLLTHGSSGSVRREYQSKNSSANPSLQHHERLFNETPLDWNQQRAQNLRNESTAGRSYNIVNGGRVEYFPPTIPEKQHQWQAHPSVSIHPFTR